MFLVFFDFRESGVTWFSAVEHASTRGTLRNGRRHFVLLQTVLLMRHLDIHIHEHHKGGGGVIFLIFHTRDLDAVSGVGHLQPLTVTVIYIT